MASKPNEAHPTHRGHALSCAHEGGGAKASHLERYHVKCSIPKHDLASVETALRRKLKKGANGSFNGRQQDKEEVVRALLTRWLLMLRNEKAQRVRDKQMEATTCP